MWPNPYLPPSRWGAKVELLGVAEELHTARTDTDKVLEVAKLENGN